MLSHMGEFVRQLSECDLIFATCKRNCVFSPKKICFYSCLFGKHNYTVLISLFVCVRPCLCVCVCFCMIIQKEIDLGTRNWNRSTM